MMAESSWTPLLARFAENVSAFGEKRLFEFVDDHGKTVKVHSYVSFDSLTDRLALAMVGEGGWGLSPKDKVLLVYPPGLDFIVAFFACLKADVIAVPVYPPRPGFSKDLRMFISVQSDCGANIALTNSSYDFAKRIAGFKSFLTGSNLKWPSVKWLVTDEGKLPKIAGSLDDYRTTPNNDAIAFFQYTSGSTSKPKGVMISQGNLGHNLATIVDALEASPSTYVCSWLPQYHDMGLIGSYLGICYCGGSGTYMSPISFIKDPPLWINIVASRKATHLQAPNFAYKLVVRKWKQKDLDATKVDLSSVKHIFNAAEPIEADAIDDFLLLFAASNLSKSAMSPGYGLAEHTVYVSDHGQHRMLVDKVALEKDRVVVPTENEKNGAVMIGCGNPHRNSERSGIKVRIVNEESCEALGEDKVGEIWITSPSKAQGYYGMGDLTKSDFHGTIANEKTASGDWLRSGDLGFIHDGELFICGRIKDLIIIRGRNHYPQDIEHTVEQADSQIRPGCVAAFTISSEHGDGEYLGIVAEVRESKVPDPEGLISKLKHRIAAEHGITPHAIIFIKERTVPKTTSGKISRYRARAAYNEGDLQQVHRWIGNAKDEIIPTASEEDAFDVDGNREGDAESKTEKQPALIPIEEGRNGRADPGLEGQELLDALKEEIYRLMEEPPEDLATDVALHHLGMDSVTLTQFKGVLSTAYATEIEEIELFDEETTLEYIRRRVEGAPMAPKFAEMLGEVGGDAGGSGSASAANPPDKKSKKKPKRPKQKMFGCFAICGL